MFATLTSSQPCQLPLTHTVILGPNVQTIATELHPGRHSEESKFLWLCRWNCVIDSISLGYPASIRCVSPPHCLIRPRPYPYTLSDLPDNPAIHVAFLFLFVLSMLALLLTAFSDPGICATEKGDSLKLVRKIEGIPSHYEKPWCIPDSPYRLSKTLLEEDACVQKHFA